MVEHSSRSGSEDTHLSRSRSSAKTSRVLPDGHLFGRYTIRRLLGRGAMGVVYLADDSVLRRQVALKIPQLPDQNPELLERFYREAQVSAGLRHANICPVYDVGEVGGTHYISMAYINGQSLRDLLQARPIVVDQTVAWMITMAEALSVAHRQGVVHRDLKPDNVMIDEHDQPVLMDFGLAFQLQHHDADRLSVRGALIGTPAYMPPEHARPQSGPPHPAADIYSLGAMFYELLTRRLPFEGPPVTVLAKLVTEPPKRPSLLVDLDPQLEAICLQMLAKDPRKRHDSMADVALSLKRWQSSIETFDGRTAWPHPSPPVQPDSSTRSGTQTVHAIADQPTLANPGGSTLVPAGARLLGAQRSTASVQSTTRKTRSSRTSRRGRAGSHGRRSGITRGRKRRSPRQPHWLLQLAIGLPLLIAALLFLRAEWSQRNAEPPESSPSVAAPSSDRTGNPSVSNPIGSISQQKVDQSHVAGSSLKNSLSDAARQIAPPVDGPAQPTPPKNTVADGPSGNSTQQREPFDITKPFANLPAGKTTAYFATGEFGRDWEVRPIHRRSEWKIAAGVVSSSAVSKSSLWTQNVYDNFTLKLDFKLGDGADGGIFLRSFARPAFHPSAWCLEITLKDQVGEVPDPGDYACGGVWDVARPQFNPYKKGEWNSLEVTAIGRFLRAEVNGVETVNLDLLQAYQTKGFRRIVIPRGYLGLQSYRGDLAYRNVRLTTYATSDIPEAARLPASPHLMETDQGDGHEGAPIRAFAMTSAGRVLTGDDNGLLRYWDIVGGQIRHIAGEILGERPRIREIAVSPDGTTMFVSEVRVRKQGTRNLASSYISRWTLPGLDWDYTKHIYGPIDSITIDPKDNRCVLSTRKGIFKSAKLDPRNVQLLTVLRPQALATPRIYGPLLMTTNRDFFYYHNGGVLAYRDLDTSSVLQSKSDGSLTARAKIECLLSDMNGQSIYYLDKTGSIHKSDRFLKSSAELLNYSTQHVPKLLAIDRQERYLAIGTLSGRVAIVSLRLNRIVTDMPLHRGGLTGLAFTPDGRSLVSSGKDGIVRVLSLDFPWIEKPNE